MPETIFFPNLKIVKKNKKCVFAVLQNNQKTCFSKEREARRHIRVAEACNSKSEIVLELVKHAASSNKSLDNRST